MRIQRWLRCIVGKRRQRATTVIQRAWRVHLSKKKIAHCSRAYRHLKQLEKLERNAKVLQRTLGKHTAYCRLIQSSELARYPHVMTQQSELSRLTTDHDSTVRELKQQLRDAIALGKRLASQESSLTSDVDGLQSRLREAKAQLAQDHERVERFHALAAYRRTKDDASIAHQLDALETQMRRDIRLELEREFEARRRAQIRDRSNRQQQQVRVDETSAHTVSTSRLVSDGEPSKTKAQTAAKAAGRGGVQPSLQPEALDHNQTERCDAQRIRVDERVE